MSRCLVHLPYTGVGGAVRAWEPRRVLRRVACWEGCVLMQVALRKADGTGYSGVNGQRGAGRGASLWFSAKG